MVRTTSYEILRFSCPRRGAIVDSFSIGGPSQHFHQLVQQNRQVQAELIDRVQDPKNPGELHENVLEGVHGRVFITQRPFFQERPADQKIQHPVPEVLNVSLEESVEGGPAFQYIQDLELVEVPKIASVQNAGGHIP
jgi:hypothetical protein